MFYCMNCEDKVLGKSERGRGVPNSECVDGTCVPVPDSPVYDPETSIIWNGGNVSPSYSPMFEENEIYND